MKRAALYARVSTDIQKDEGTIETQIYELKTAIVNDGHTLMADCIYQDEGWSGAFLERPDLDRLRQDAKDHKFDIVYVYDRGRLSRRFIYQEIVIEELAGHQVEFKSLHDVNGTSPEELLMGKITGIFAEYERVKIAERFRLGKLNKVRNGDLLGYTPPYGYDYIPVSGQGIGKKNGQFVINEQEAEVVRMIYHWVGVEGISLREVIRRLYDMGIPPKKQKRPNWTKGPISRLLINESYIGKHYYYKKESVLPKNPKAATVKKYTHKHTNKTSRRDRDRSEWLMVKVPRIIDDELFNKVQRQLRLNAKHNPRNKKHQYLFSGLIYCKCGERRVGDGPDGKKYYRCTARIHSFPLPNRCRLGGVNVNVMDAVAWEKIKALLSDPELVRQQIERYTSKQMKSLQNGPDAAQIQQNLKALDAEERRYAKMYGQAMMSADVYKDQMKSVIERRQALQSLLAKPVDSKVQKLQNLEPEKLVAPFTEMLENLSFEQRLFTVRKIIDKVIATKEEVILCGNLPISPIIQHGKAEHESINRHRRPA